MKKESEPGEARFTIPRSVSFIPGHPATWVRKHPNVCGASGSGDCDRASRDWRNDPNSNFGSPVAPGDTASTWQRSIETASGVEEPSSRPTQSPSPASCRCSSLIAAYSIRTGIARLASCTWKKLDESDSGETRSKSTGPLSRISDRAAPFNFLTLVGSDIATLLPQRNRLRIASPAVPVEPIVHPKSGTATPPPGGPQLVVDLVPL